MSTNKTQNYQLHAWEPSDDFRLHEINENFAALDGALMDMEKRKVQIIAGYYAGDGQVHRTIDLGVPLLAVILDSFRGTRDPNSTHGGIAAKGITTNAYMSVSGTGFTVSHYSNDSYDRLNGKNFKYAYIAFVDPNPS